MKLVDLQNFKVKECSLDHSHQPLQAPYYLNCFNHHSKEDKRRNPFKVLQKGKSLAYMHFYFEEYYSVFICANYVEYLFHPNVYKRIRCENANKYNGRQLECNNKYCPYLHAGEEQEFECMIQLQKEILFEEQKENNSKSKMTNSLQQLKEIRLSLVSNSDISQKLRNDVTKMRESFLKQLQIKIAKSKPKQEMKPIANDQTKMQIMSAAEQIGFSYAPYNYFYYGQKLPIIEDRHHQFKNYKDISASDIVPMVMKYITAFLNSQGGVLYIGIDDGSVVYGLKVAQHEFDKFLLSVDRECRFNIQPPLIPQKYAIRRIPVQGAKRGKQLYVVEVRVMPGQKRLSVYNRECFMRMNASTHRLDALDILEYIRHNGECVNFTELVSQMRKTIGKLKVEEMKEVKEDLQKMIGKLDVLIQQKQVRQAQMI